MASQPKFVFTSTEAGFVGAANTYKALSEQAAKAMDIALAPISNKKAGAFGLTLSGVVYLGVNLEFPGLPHEDSIQAEQFLVTAISLNSEDALTHLALYADGTLNGEPSIQYLQEIGDKIQVLVESADERDWKEGLYRRLTLEKFGPDGIRTAEASLLNKLDNRLVLSDDSNGTLGGLSEVARTILRSCSNPDHCNVDHLKCKALTAANRSYAPYSKSPSGVALICDGKVYSGWYIESVVSSASMGPVQAALVDFMIRGEGKGFDKITGAVLVEKKDAMVRQAAKARWLLKKITTPECDFQVFYCCTKTGEN